MTSDVTIHLPTLPILIVDDEQPIRELLHAVFEDEGLQVLTAPDGRSALALLQRQQVSLILTDLMMPFVTGLELARHVHESPQTSNLPVLLMSAAPPPPLEAAIISIIRKPFDITVVVEQVLEALRR